MPHAAELHSPVRALAHRLANGKMSWVDYREQRAAAIELVVSGAEPLEYSPAVMFDDPTLPKEFGLAQAYIDLDEVDRQPRRWPAHLAVAVLGAVIVAAAWVLWQSTRPPVVAQAPVVVMSDAESALDEFVKAGDWSAPAVESLHDRWSSFPAGERADARGTSAWRNLRMDLQQQVTQQSVLATVDETGEAQAQLARLEALQQALQD